MPINEKNICTLLKNKKTGIENRPNIGRYVNLDESSLYKTEYPSKKIWWGLYWNKTEKFYLPRKLNKRFYFGGIPFLGGLTLCWQDNMWR